MQDMIDFPCSETWLGYYHERGLTPRKPASEEKQLLNELTKLREAIELNNKIMKYIYYELKNQKKKNAPVKRNITKNKSFLER